MKTRIQNIGLALSLGVLAISGGAFAADEFDFQEGVHYERISPEQPTETGDKVEVREMFWYGCPHCFSFEPYVERWLRKKPVNAEFVRQPGIFRANWEPHARAYYVSEILGVFEKIHMPLFNAIHQQRRNLNDENALAAFFAEHGVKQDDFRKAYRSFAVETKVRHARVMGQRYGVDGVPSIIVNGKYRFSNRSTGSATKTLELINYLVEKESK